MSEYHPNKPRTGRPRMTWRRIAAFWPLLIWVAVVGVALATFLKGVEFNRVNGIIDVIQEAIATDEDGRIRKILVRTGQEVKEGDPLVEMDTAVLTQQIASLEAGIRSDLEDKILTYQNDLNRLKSEKRELERDEASDQGELAVIAESVKKIEAAIAAQPASRALFADALARVQGDYGRLQAVTPLYEKQKKAVDEDIARLQTEIDKLRNNTNPEELASANGDLAELQELKILRQRGTITSSHTGMVDRIDKDEGEFVVKGDPILRVVAYPQLVRAFLPEDQLKEVTKGQTVWISPQNDHTVSFATQVNGISPRVNFVPDTSSPLPNQILHGREIIMTFPQGSNLLPGQRIIVHLEEPGKITLFAKFFRWGK